MRRLMIVVLSLLTIALPLAARGVSAQANTFLAVSQDATHGAILTDAEGKTVYLFTKDTTPGQSACTDQCAEAWPPLTPTDSMSLPVGMPGKLGTIDRSDGSKQVTYNDIPLYHYAKDDEAGDTYGEGVGGVWFVVPPGAELGEYPAAPGEGTPVPASTLQVGFTEKLGPFLVDAKGMTVYLFKKDTTPGQSACDADCAATWPPVPASDGMMLLPGIHGTLGSIDRADGSKQLTYNDIPLYHYAADKNPGDTNGQDVGDVWYIVSTGMKQGEEPHHGAEGTATPAS